MAVRVAEKLRRRRVDPLSNVMKCIEEGELERLKKLLCDKATELMFRERLSKDRVAKNYSPLVRSIMKKRIDIFRYILQEFGSDVNIEQETSAVIEGGYPVEGATPLWTASTLGHFEFVKELVSRGANIEHTTDSRSSPLRGAAFDGHCEVCEFLIDKGADINKPNQVGQSPLTIAAAMQKKICVELLLKKGADVNHKGHNGDTPLHVSVESGSVEIAKILVEHGARNNPNDVGFTPAILACCYGHDEVMQFLDTRFSLGPDEKYNCYCLLAAKDILGGNDSGTEKWLKAAVSVRSKFKQFFTDIPQADSIYDGLNEPESEEDVQHILQDETRMFFISSVFCERILGKIHPTTSFYIRICGDMALAEERYSKCVELWQRSLEFDHAARMAYELQITEDLLFSVRGFSIMAKVGFATRVEPHFRWGMKEFHKAHESKISELSVICCLSRMIASWFMVADQIMDISKRSREYDLIARAVDDIILSMRSNACPLLIAVLRNLPQSNSGASKDIAKTKLPLNKAVALFLDRGCSLNVEDEDGNLPLHLAVKLREDSSKGVIKTLLEYNAHLDAVNYDGLTALDLARQDDVGYEALRHDNIQLLEAASLSHFPLQCLASKAVVRYEIDFAKVLPRNVTEYVAWHEHEETSG